MNYIPVPKTGTHSVCKALGLPHHHRFPPTDQPAFCFFRDPYKRAVSTFHYLQNLRLKRRRDFMTLSLLLSCTTLNDFWENVSFELLDLYPVFRPQTGWFGGASPVIVYNFENISEAWPKLLEDLGEPDNPLPHLNRGSVVEADALTASAKNRISEYYAADLELLSKTELNFVKHVVD